MKKLKRRAAALAMSAVMAIGMGIPQVSAQTIGEELTVTPCENMKTVLHFKDGGTREYDGIINAAALERSGTATVESYELFSGGKSVLSVELNGGTGGSSVGAEALNGFYAVDLSLDGNRECFLTGLRADRVDEIEAKVVSACQSGEGFEIEDVGFIDAEKTGKEDFDSLMCWAAANSNALTYTGWAALAGFNNEDELFEEYIDAFYDDGGYDYSGAAWFFNGVDAYEPECSIMERESGAFATDYAYDKVAHHYNLDDGNSPAAAKALTEDLRRGCGVVICGQFEYTENGGTTLAGGHAVACWGFVVDNDYNDTEMEHYSMFFISDSDSDMSGENDRRTAPNKLMALHCEPYEFELSSLDSWISRNYLGFVPYEFVCIEPYSANLEKETSGYATKNKYTTPDLVPTGVYVMNDEDSPVSATKIVTGGDVYIYPQIKNLSYADFEGTINYTVFVRNSAGRIVNSYNTTEDISAYAYWQSYDVGKFCLGNLPVDTYTVSVSLNQTHTALEAYYYNNTGEFTFDVVEPPEYYAALTSPELIEGEAYIDEYNRPCKTMHVVFRDAPEDVRMITDNYDAVVKYYDEDSDEWTDWTTIMGSDNYGFGDYFSLNFDIDTRYRRAMLSIWMDMNDGVTIMLDPIEFSYEVPDELDNTIDPDKIKMKITTLETDVDGDVVITGEFEGISESVATGEFVENHFTYGTCELSYYDKETGEWLPPFEPSDFWVLNDEYPLCFSGYLDPKYAKAKFSITLHFADGTEVILTSDEIDLESVPEYEPEPNPIDVAFTPESTTLFTPVYTTDVSFANDEMLQFVFFNRTDKTIFGDYRIYAVDTYGFEYEFSPLTSFSIKPNGFFETEEIREFESLYCGKYTFKVEIETAENTVFKEKSGLLEVFPDVDTDDMFIGDVDQDGFVDIKDATKIQRYLAGQIKLNDMQLEQADTDGDGMVTISDVTEIQKYLAKIISYFSI